MSETKPPQTKSDSSYPPWLFVILPAVAMLLGWGLRGYIGGGPYGAMIPGCFVALSICLLLNYKRETAAIAAVFGAIGIGFGGQMTYGQTLGFLREADTIYWGVIGCIIKGGVWGLLGGAVMGLGLSRDQYGRASLIIGLLIMVAAFHLGRELINEPRLIYFSNLEDRPRDESWAGMLFAAIALLSYMRTQADGVAIRTPLTLALFGLVGGAIGFGGGSLWLAYGPPIAWIGWWKMMEFSFGFVLGGALGGGAYVCRQKLTRSGQEGQAPPPSWLPMIAFFALLIVIFAGFPLIRFIFSSEAIGNSATLQAVLRKGLSLIFSFTTLGTIALIISLFSRHVAWHVAITLTFFQTVRDYVRDLDDPERFGFVWPVYVQWIVNIVVALLVAAGVHYIHDKPRAIPRLLMLVLWSCYATACVRSFMNLNYFNPDDDKNFFQTLIEIYPTVIYVHGTFTVSAIITTILVLMCFREHDAA